MSDTQTKRAMENRPLIMRLHLMHDRIIILYNDRYMQCHAHFAHHCAEFSLFARAYRALKQLFRCPQRARACMMHGCNRGRNAHKYSSSNRRMSELCMVHMHRAATRRRPQTTAYYTTLTAARNGFGQRGGGCESHSRESKRDYYAAIIRLLGTKQHIQK